MRIPTLAFLILCMAGVSARAQGDFSNRLVSLPAPGATCIAVSEAAGLAVVGQRGATNHHFLVYKLNPDGSAATPPVAVSFPVPDPVKAMKVHPIGMALHPSLPLLYVWRDVEGAKPDTAEEKIVFNSFDHAMVYAITNGTLLQTNIFAKGSNFLCEQTYGLLTVDETGKRLFVPNMRDPTNKQTAIGYYDLDDKGQPVPIPVPIPGTLDGYGVSKYETQVLPRWVNVNGLRPYGTGLGMVAPNPTTVVFSASQGFGLWDTGNRRGYLGWFVISGAGDHWIIGTPSLPVVFAASVNGNLLIRIEHVDGYLTLMPRLTYVGGAAFQSRPVVIPGKPPRLAIGGTAQIFVVTLDATGKFAADAPAAIGQPAAVRALAWSPRFNRLYAAVDKAP